MSDIQIETEDDTCWSAIKDAADALQDKCGTRNRSVRLYHGTTIDENVIKRYGLKPRRCEEIVEELKSNIGTNVIPKEIETEILRYCMGVDDKYDLIPISLTDDFEQAADYAKNALRHSGGKGGGETLTLARERICTEDAFEEFRNKHHPDCRMDHEIKPTEKKAKAKVVVIKIPFMELYPYWRKHFEWVNNMEKRRGAKIQTPTTVSGIYFTKQIPPNWILEIINVVV